MIGCKKLFEFKWIKGSINDNIIDYCKNNKIEFRYSSFGNLELDVEQLGIWFAPYTETKRNNVKVYI